MSQKLEPSREAFAILLGDKLKSDSLLVIRNSQIGDLYKAMTIQNNLVAKLEEQVNLKTNNEVLYKTSLDYTTKEYDRVVIENGKLVTKVKLFKRLTVVMPILTAGGIAYILLK